MKKDDRSQVPLTDVAVRLFLVSDTTREPISDVIVQICAGKVPERRILATQKSDASGYVSFKLETSVHQLPDELIASIPESDDLEKGFAVRELLQDGAISWVLPAAKVKVSSASIPFTSFPDAQDAALSPSSIGAGPIGWQTPNPCSALIPNGFAVRRYRATKFVVDNMCNTKKFVCAHDGLAEPGPEFLTGKAVEYEISWHSTGFSLGDLIYSVSLAPCEQVNLGFSDWTVNVSATRSESTALQETQAVTTRRETTLSEVMHATSDIETKANTFGGNLSLSLAFGEKNTLGIGAFFGHVDVSDERTFTTTTQQNLKDSIDQAASLVASRKSLVVYQASQHEQQVVQTRSVRNHNHCHTLNLMYYQVNRNYRVITGCRGWRNVILIRYPVMVFTPQLANCSKHFLTGQLLDPSLEHCFEALGEFLHCCRPKTVPRRMVDRLYFEVTAQQRDHHGMIPHIVLVLIRLASGAQITEHVFVNWTAGGVRSFEVSVSPPVDRNSIVSISLAPFATTLDVSSARVTYSAVGIGGVHPLCSSGPSAVSTENPWSQVVEQESVAEESDCEEAKCCVTKLISHLNCHRLYYNQLTWLAEHADERVSRWRCCKFEQQWLLSMIENAPIGVIGDFVVFPAGPLTQPSPPIPPTFQLISMPTNGVYSEGILGRCGTCEKADDGVFWDWKDSPCPDSASKVELASPGHDLKLTDMLSPDEIKKLMTLTDPADPKFSLTEVVIKELLKDAQAGSKAAADFLKDILKELKPK